MSRRPRLTISRLMIAIAAFAVPLAAWLVDPAFAIVLACYGLCFLPLLRPGRPVGK